ncbi:MAG: AMP-binding protein, partial [Gammaproteobacteria bacterium]|nr:AMP-binding protein [Gammaproteobacteria bacterium]
RAQPDFNRDLVSNMRLFISGSAPLTEQTFREFSERTGMAILERYGMSETLMNTSNPLKGERKAGTVGFPLPGISLRIADERGMELVSGEVGGIELKGPNVFKGYWEMPDRTAQEFRHDGYFITGDMGVQDEDGRVSIVGREKDVVISGGLNVYPAEVETAIGNLPDVADVAVIGAPHPDFGEGVVAVVVSAVGNDVDTSTVREQLKGELAGFKQPQHVETVRELPRNAMGKIQKNSLRDQFREVFTRTEPKV